MRTHVSFDADSRDDDDGLPPGEDLAQLITAGLRSSGFGCSDPDPTAYSFVIDGEAGSHRFTVTLGFVGDDDGRQWLAIVEPRKAGLLRRATPSPAPVSEALHELLTAASQVRDVQWFTEQEWNDTGFGRGAPTPT